MPVFRPTATASATLTALVCRLLLQANVQCDRFTCFCVYKDSGIKVPGSNEVAVEKKSSLVCRKIMVAQSTLLLPHDARSFTFQRPR